MNLITLIDKDGILGIVILVVLIVVIAVIAFVIYITAIRPKLKDQTPKITEEEAAKQELDRVLQPVEDEKTANEINNYKEDEE